MTLKGRKTKSPPIMSHEFVIQNHADIVGGFAMIFVAGMIFQATTAFTQPFILLQYNETVEGPESETAAPYQVYGNGIRDLMAVFFYTLITIIVHQVIQEYILDKVNRKLHLSKIKHSKFNESGQLFAFALICVVWASYLIYESGYLSDISSLWNDYPTVSMRFWFKMFFIIQICYWIHVFPEFYFQKVKKEEMPKRINYALLHLAFIVPAYVMNFQKLALILLNLHYLAEGVQHLSKLLYFMDRQPAANLGFSLCNILSPVVRASTVTLAGLTFIYGLPRLPSKPFSIAEGNYNTQLIRIASFTAVGLIQFYMFGLYCQFHLNKRREQQAEKKSVKESRPEKKATSNKRHKGAGDAQSSNGKKRS